MHENDIDLLFSLTWHTNSTRQHEPDIGKDIFAPTYFFYLSPFLAGAPAMADIGCMAATANVT